MLFVFEDRSRKMGMAVGKKKIKDSFWLWIIEGFLEGSFQLWLFKGGEDLVRRS